MGTAADQILTKSSRQLGRATRLRLSWLCSCMSKKSATDKPLVLLTVADACLRLQVSRRTVYRMVVEGLLPMPRRMGKFRRSYFEQVEFDKACLTALA
jgi:excisionase family DNA binding protein